MDDIEMIHRLKTYQNGVHGDFFLEVAERITSLITEKAPVAKSPAAMAGSAALVSELSSEWCVLDVDLDDDTPYCTAIRDEFTDKEETIKFLIPEQIAYYMRRHYCGSRKMHNALIDQGKEKVRGKIKAALGIE